MIAYTGFENHDEIYIMDVKGTIPRRLQQPATTTPSWSPDGTGIAFVTGMAAKSTPNITEPTFAN